MSELRLGQDRAYLERKAKDEGLIVFLPLANEIFLDLDTPNAYENEGVMAYIESAIVDHSLTESASGAFQGITVLDRLRTVSQSGNTHMYFRMSRYLTDLERVIFQVCLGSDPIKELFSFIQMHHAMSDIDFECECPIALFETPEQAKRVESWRTKK